ncbi:MAG: hypothetical protein SGARI_004123 [Bacillariaceae sp.]
MIQKNLLRVLIALATLTSTTFAVSFGGPEIHSAVHSLNHALPHVKTAAHTIPHAKTAAATLQHGGFDLLGAYKHLLQIHPLPTKMMTGATLAVAGDAIAQSQDKDTDDDKQRAASFAVFDMAYRALQHFSFPIIVAACHGQFLGALPGVGGAFDASQLAAMEETLASQLGIVPFLYYPAFFALTGFMQGLTPSGAVSRAKENFIPLMKRNLLFWIPMQFIQFGYIQEDLQIPFLSTYTPEKEVQETMMNNTANKQLAAEAAAVVIAEATAKAMEEEDDTTVTVTTPAALADAR